MQQVALDYQDSQALHVRSWLHAAAINSDEGKSSSSCIEHCRLHHTFTATPASNTTVRSAAYVTLLLALVG